MATLECHRMLNSRQQEVLLAACRRIAPGAYASGHDQRLADALAARIAGLAPFQRRRTCQALNILGSRLLALLVLRRTTGFARLPADEQDRLLRRCERSRSAALRLLFTGLKRLIVHTWYSLPEARAGFGHRGALTGRAPEFKWEGALPGAQPLVAAEPRAREQTRVVPAGVYEAHNITDDLTISTEFCVIGSGVGGAVAASTLAEAGRDVVLLEAGPFRTAADFSMHEMEALQHLYAEAGMRSTDDLSFSLLQGRCVGGGSTVNWMVMLRTPDYVLDEWTREYGMEGVTPAELRPVFEQFERDTHVQLVPEQAHSRVNQLLLDGSRAMGWRAHSASVNAMSCMRSGLCGLGCPYDAKQSALKNYLARALHAGARLYCDTMVERVSDSTTRASVWARTTHGRRVLVHAKKVIVAAGAVETPALLQRSGLGNRNVGRHLRLHPTTAVVGVYDEPVYAASGIPLTTYNNEFIQLRGDYGHWIETPPFAAGLAAIALPGFGAAHRERMQRFPFMAPFIVLTRDGSPQDPSEGSVRWLRSGRVRVQYRLSTADRAILLHGLETAARIHFAAGAKSAFGLHRMWKELRSDEDVPWLRELNASTGDPVLFSAHVNGTCRVSASSRMGACAPTGRLYGSNSIYVMDGSLLPTAPGVNPHETIAAVVTVLSRRLLQED